MVYEAREGQTFLLGASTWRIEEITRDRVLVSPAPGRARRRALLEGRGRRPAVRARRADRRARRASSSRSRTTTAREPAARRLPPRRAGGANLARVPARAGGARPAWSRPTARSSSSASATRSATGACACSRRSAAACTRRGRWRSARGCATRSASRRSRSGRTTASRSTSRTPTRRPRSPTCCSTRTRSRTSSLGELAQTALFGARFRENAARALLIPRRRPGQRTPLWQQRLKAQSLLQVARRYPQFPIVLETYRECLQDVFDLPALQRHPARRSRPRELDLVDVETAVRVAVRRPRCSSTTSRRTCTRTTRRAAERRAQALSLDRELLRELHGRRGAARAARRRRARGGRGVARARRRGTPTSCTTCSGARADLVAGEYDPGFAETLLRERRALRVRLGGTTSACSPPRTPGSSATRSASSRRAACPRRSSSRSTTRSRAVARRASRGRTARSRRPRSPPASASSASASRRRWRRSSARTARPRRAPAGWHRARVVRPRRPAPASGARRSRVLRREVEPVEQAALGRFLPAWHGIGRRQTLREALVPLQGLPLPVSLWETDVLPRRVPGYRPARLDALCASGEVVWVGAGLDRVARLLPRGRGRCSGAPAGEPSPEGAGARRDPRGARAAARSSGPICSRPPELDPADALACASGSSSGRER